MIRFVDTHCHLHDAAAFPSPEDEITEALKVGVCAVILSAIDPDDWQRAQQLVDSNENVYAIYGRHPNYAGGFDGTELETLRAFLRGPKALALGEIGLDYHWNFADPESQRKALTRQLDLAWDSGSPVVFHARDAVSDLLDILEDGPKHSYLFHCFSGNSVEAERASQLDAYFGIDGPITYKRSDTLRRIVANLPRERIVLETDSPYMPPTPHRGKGNRPAYIPLIAEGLAGALSISIEECAAITTANAERFFGLRFPANQL